MNDPTIRTARTDELEVLVSIDEDASTLYAEWGLALALPPTHPFSVAERALWRSSLERGSVYLALEAAQQAIGFAALAVLDGVAYLDQLSVRRAAMQRGVGRRLLETAIAWARSRAFPALSLTTYHHVPFNHPFYERHGFQVVAPEQLTPGLVHHLEEQRRHLPAPDQRIAMRLPLV